MVKVGIRELKQNASAVIARVKSGESLEVTEHGTPVAIITPIPAPSDVLDRLIAEGVATPATGNLSELPPPLVTKSKKLPSEALAELRAEER